jgi:hypothetical protein
MHMRCIIIIFFFLGPWCDTPGIMGKRKKLLMGIMFFKSILKFFSHPLGKWVYTHVDN